MGLEGWGVETGREGGARHRSGQRWRDPFAHFSIRAAATRPDAMINAIREGGCSQIPEYFLTDSLGVVGRGCGGGW